MGKDIMEDNLCIFYNRLTLGITDLSLHSLQMNGQITHHEARAFVVQSSPQPPSQYCCTGSHVLHTNFLG